MSGRDEPIDVAIIGAGPAGSSAALQLARTGRRVVIIEKQRLPRPKACGGCLSGAACARLAALLGPDHALPGIPGTQITFVMGSIRLRCASRGRTRLVVRSEFDWMLTQAAVEAGAELHQGRAATLEPDGNRWVVHAGGRRIRARTILLAGGAAALPDSFPIHGLPCGPRMAAQQWVQAAGASLPGPGETELHWLRGGYVGLAGPQAGRCVVAMAANIPRRQPQSPLLVLQQLNPRAEIWSKLSAERSGQGSPRDSARGAARGAAGFPWQPSRMGCDNVLLIGDLAGYAEPFTGEGIGQALFSASCAAEAVMHGGGQVTAVYESLMRREHTRVLRRTRRVGQLLRAPLLHGLAGWPLWPTTMLSRLIEAIHVRGAA